ncbi:VOC family protein [Nitrospirillum sp. BR 11752]|uniref:VOC family protein n=1 Tax=Nitrospirillum sp. BR 11752 TaxID=3104293 RepID=UPI002EAC64B1|nr:VOC family protein [Nitrospirillum sp. BR 11752]
MAKQIFINLPVRDLPRAMAFYTAIGAVNNPQFTDETAACMVFSDTIFVMLLTHDKWRVFTQKPITDTHASGALMLALSCGDRAAVDTMAEAASRHGGTADVNPKQDLGFMYSRSFEDPDGHVWEPLFMDTSQLPPQP